MYRYSCRIVMSVCSIEWCAGEMLAGANAVQFIGGLLSESVMAQGGGPGADPCRGCAGSLCSCVLCHNSMREQHSYDGTTISVSVDRHSTIIVLARECVSPGTQGFLATTVVYCLLLMYVGLRSLMLFRLVHRL